MNKPFCFEGRKDFIWGISGHNKNYAAYPECFLEEQIKKAAGLGINIYRLNFSPETPEDFDYLDNVLDCCDKYGIKLFLILYDRKFTKEDDPQELYERVKNVCLRYKGRIPLYQISNEQDLACLDPKIKGSDGDRPEHYDREAYIFARENMKAILRAVSENDPAAKTVINFSWKHSGILRMLDSDGLKWDVNAIDWYSDMDKAADINTVLESLSALPQKEIYIAEGNQWGGDYFEDERSQADYLLDAMNRFYNHHDTRIKGYMIYELLDEPSLEKGEAHFGLFLNDKDGNIGRPKTAYAEIANILNKNK